MSRIRPLALLAAIALVLAACGSSASSPPRADSPGSTVAPSESPATARPVVVDTDLGADDLMALAYLAARPDLDLRAVTVSGTGLARCPAGARTAAAVLARLGRAEVPVGCGSSETVGSGHAVPDAWRAASDAAYGIALPEPQVPLDRPAVDVLATAIDGAPAPVELLVLGPATNAARAFEARPDLPGRIGSITFMGGALAVPGNVAGSGVADENGVAEWNVFADPTAWQAVLGAGRPVTIVPLDATDDLPLSRGFYLELAANRDTEAARLAWEVLDRSPFLLSGGQSFWDQLAAVTLAGAEGVSFEDRSVRVETTSGREHGRTEVDPAGSPGRVAVAADEQVFRDALISGLNGGRRVASPPESPPTVALTFDGSMCDAIVPEGLRAGFVAVELNNESASNVVAGIVRLPDGMTLDDVRRLATEDPDQLGTLPEAAAAAGASPGATGREIGVIGAGAHVMACITYEPALSIVGVRGLDVVP